MQRVLAFFFAMSLLFLSAGVALDANIAQYGALNTRPGGADPGVEAVAMVVSSLAILGAFLLTLGAVLSLLRASRHHQWGWLAVLVILLPTSLYAFLKAGFEADVLAGLGSLLAPVAYLVYTLKAWPAPRSGEPGV